MPRWERNDADALGTSLTDEYHFDERLEIEVAGERHQAQYTPHHLIPGNASWPQTKLQKWVDKRHKQKYIKQNIGYDVNSFDNGVSLPGNAGYRALKRKSWTAYRSQAEYAIEAMKASAPTRQFHDAHPAYNEFVTKVLDKIAEKLDRKVDERKAPGCSHPKCAGNSREKKFDPPYDLLSRLDRVALRLEGYLVGNPRKWRMPIYTSRFALMYKLSISETAAQSQLSEAQATPDKF